MKMLTLTRRRAGDGAGLSERDQRLVWRIAALLLDYPGAQTLAMADQLDHCGNGTARIRGRAAARLPA